MKTLKDHTLLYDDECPLCREYTKAFVKTGMLDANGREPYTACDKTNYSSVDWNKARNEIALVDRQEGKVFYGVEALSKVVGTSMPPLQPLLAWYPIKWCLTKLYSFISYNRRVIIPAETSRNSDVSCIPDFNLNYRIAFILVAWLATSLALTSYTNLLIPFVPESSFSREFLICGGQVVFQGLIVLMLRKDSVITYLGNLMTISLAGAILLLPAFLLTSFITTPLFFLLYFVVVVGLMFLEHLRRTSLLQLPWIISASWVAYRLGVLYFII